MAGVPKKVKNPKHSINVGLVGKYVELPDAYKSIAESFIHSGSMNQCKVNLKTTFRRHN